MTNDPPSMTTARQATPISEGTARRLRTIDASYRQVIAAAEGSAYIAQSPDFRLRQALRRDGSAVAEALA